MTTSNFHIYRQAYQPKIICEDECINEKFSLNSSRWQVVEKYPKKGSLLCDNENCLYIVESCTATSEGYIIKVLRK